jgi:very-short-patch-repair endonuclease
MTMENSKYPTKRYSAKPKKFIQKNLLRPEEVEFFNKLKTGLKGLHIFPQVSMNAVLDVENQTSIDDRKYWWAQIIDFVVCTPRKFKILALIELDGPSHDSHERQVKDEMRDDRLQEAGYIIKRYDNRHPVSAKQLNKDFKEIIYQYHRIKLTEQIQKYNESVTEADFKEWKRRLYLARLSKNLHMLGACQEFCVKGIFIRKPAFCFQTKWRSNSERLSSL